MIMILQFTENNSDNNDWDDDNDYIDISIKHGSTGLVLGFFV